MNKQTNIYNSRSVEDRKMDTLIGLSKGLLADGKLVQEEVEFLLQWLLQNRDSNNPIIINIETKVIEILNDGIVDNEEAEELFQLLSKLNGDEVALGELAKPTNLPLCSPPPEVKIRGSIFLFTGTFNYGTRAKCTSLVEELGGAIGKSVTKSINYLVIGSYVTDAWAHESFGRKIEKAMSYRDMQTSNIKIISENHWLEAVNRTK
ncbi:MAG TPA: NAD-dependent DNA ligase [Alteromonas australica]|uniref:NAD-dependent DNA ligase n=1 Tax=Alteromonas australica TaxID=589873 RepID=A0A358E181_9ALTE|nr:BRCT domain-containing protein [Alteromonas australica]MBU35344.1 NAD-dependent DNA ligase [Alteromonas sp.]HAW74925.1 NAD-dependent DNA ligase [Alteromonas australica]HBU52167.1 NAD-dependent DNA ligase [Alteromonas australica]